MSKRTIGLLLLVAGCSAGTVPQIMLHHILVAAFGTFFTVLALGLYIDHIVSKKD